MTLATAVKAGPLDAVVVKLAPFELRVGEDRVRNPRDLGEVAKRSSSENQVAVGCSGNRRSRTSSRPSRDSRSYVQPVLMIFYLKVRAACALS